MIFLILVMVIMDILLIQSIIKDNLKRKQLGDIIIKVRYGKQRYVLFLVLIAAGIIVLTYFSVIRVNQYISSSYYGIKEIGWTIANWFIYLLLYFRISIKIITSGEFRENGITLTGWSINYSDIRGLHWIKENKLRINYDPDVVYIFNKLYKETWVVPDDQIDEVKKILNEKYYESF